MPEVCCIHVYKYMDITLIINVHFPNNGTSMTILTVLVLFSHLEWCRRRVALFQHYIVYVPSRAVRCAFLLFRTTIGWDDVCYKCEWTFILTFWTTFSIEISTWHDLLDSIVFSFIANHEILLVFYSLYWLSFEFRPRVATLVFSNLSSCTFRN
jgi:hypothetical protein